MTKKDLVKLLDAKYADDDEVYVRYLDDQGECIEKAVGVEDVTKTHTQGHYEVKTADGEWKKVPEDESLWGYASRDIKYVTDKTYDVTKTCIVVG